MTDLAHIKFNAEGFMTDPAQWTKEIAEVLAKQEGIETLTADHWKIIDFCRATGLADGKSPTLVVGNGPARIKQLLPSGRCHAAGPPAS